MVQATAVELVIEREREKDDMTWSREEIMSPITEPALVK
jgi:hypothetical protein